MLRRHWISAVVLVFALLLALPTVAHAEELGLVVERTAPTHLPVPLVVQTDRPGQVQLSVYRIGNPKGLLVANESLGDGDDLAWLGTGRDADAARKQDPGRLKRFRAAQVTAVSNRRVVIKTANQRHLEPVRLKEPGLYLFEAVQGRTVTRVTALVSDLALVVKREPQGILAWTVNRRTGKPWAGVEITAPQFAFGIVQTTGPDGCWRDHGSLDPEIDLVAVAGQHLAFGSETYFPAEVTDRRVYAFPHQPAYRPGERIEVKGVVRAYDGERYLLDPTVREVTVRLIDARSQAAATGKAAVSPTLGTFDLGFDLDAKAPTGSWKIVVDAEGASYEAPLTVDAYRKPAFEVVVTPTDPRVLAGGASSFDLAARFYDGGIVAGAKVEWHVLFSRVDRTLFPTDELVRLFFGTEREAYRPETLATGKGVLDAEGRLSIGVEAPAAALDGHLTLRATVFGPDRLAVVGSGSVAVAAAPIRVALESNQHLYAPEDIARVEVRVERADGQPAAGRGGVVTLAQILPGERGTFLERWVVQRPFTTDAQGHAALEVSLPTEGHFQFQVAVPREKDEGEGPPANAHVNAWVASDRPTIGLAPSTLEVIADKDHYAPGDIARFLVRAPGEGRAVLAAVEGGRLLHHEVLEAELSASIWTVAIEADHAPNVFATFATVFRGELLIESAMLRVPPVERLLTTTLTPDATELLPGATTGVEVRITDADGNPVAGAEVSVSVIDAALFALHPESVARIEAFFHSPRRNSVRTSGLLHHDSVGYAALADPAKKDGAGPPSGGAVPNTREPSDAAPPPPSASPMAPSSESGGDPEAVAESEEDADNPQFTAESEEGFVADGDVDGGDGILRERRELGLRRGGGRGGGGRDKKSKLAGSPALEARKDFRSCVFWIAALLTDADGRARIDEVTFADSLTRWRISAKSVDGATRVGSGTAQVVTRKRVAVMVTPPRFLRANDQVEIPVLARNLTSEEVTGTLDVWQTWQQVDADLGHPRNGPSRLEDITIGARETVSRPMHFNAPEADAPNVRRMIQATLETGAGSDVEIRLFPILPQGIQKAEGMVLRATDGRASGSLDVPTDAVPNTITCTVSVESGTVEAIASAIPYLIDYPHGCTEQTLNRFEPLLDVVAAVKALGIPEDRGRLAEVPTLIEAGVNRLNALRHGDGGFGWWPTDASHPAMTALVVRGLSRMLASGVDHQVATMLRDGGVHWLSRWLEQQGAEGGPTADPATLASVLVAISTSGTALPEGAFARALAERPGRHAPATVSALLQVAVLYGDTKRVQSLSQELLRTARQTEAHNWWGSEAGSQNDVERGPVRWQDDDIEATAEALLALRAGGHDDEELYRRGASWLIDHRVAGDRWRSTRDTGAAVRFLAEFVVGSSELGSGQTVKVRLGGELVGEVVIDRSTIFTDATVLTLPEDRVVPGTTLDLALEGTGRLTAGVALRYYETGPAIRQASNGLSVERRWYRIEPEVVDGKTLWKRTPVTETVPSGALLESELVVTSDEAYEYVMVRDPLAGGFEPEREYGTEVVGREKAADAHIERYDDTTLFFVTSLPAGRTVLRHLVRATHVGSFTALPAQAELMYFPATRGNSDGELIEVSAAGPAGRGGGR